MNKQLSIVLSGLFLALGPGSVGVNVGGIRNARQGNFSVSDMGSSYSDTRTIEKQVRVVTTITFYLK